MTALGEGNPLAKPLLAALKVARSKVNVLVSVQIEMSEKYLARARKRLVVANEELEESRGKEEQLHFRCGSDGVAIGTATSFSANADASGACSRCRVARPYRRVDPRARCGQVRSSACGDPAATLPASGAEEVEMLRTSVENLHRERAALRAELARQRAGDPSALMSTLIDQGDSLARERYMTLT